MKTMGIVGFAAVTLVVIGCSGAPAPVPVVGAPTELERLAGEWSGEYHGETTGRSGSIAFKLTAGADTAYGDVVMIPHQRREQRLPTQDPSAGLPTSRAPEVLSIAFVRAAGGGVTGQLVPYRDPECECLVVTRFEGRIHGDTIEGTYTSRHAGSPLGTAGGETRTGVWKVTRRKP
jgi:hypothetical protein